MKLPFETSNDAVLETLVPFVVTTPMSEEELDLRPFGLPIELRINPLHLSSETFLARIQRLDALGFGPEGLPMPRWVFFDCSELPAAIFGFARRVEDVADLPRHLQDTRVPGPRVAEPVDPGLPLHQHEGDAVRQAELRAVRGGGAPLLGISHPTVICHGRSNPRAIRNAVRVAKEFAERGLNGRIDSDLSALGRHAGA